MAALKDIKDQRFGRLVALSLAGRSKSGQAVWTARCDCGLEDEVRSNDLVSRKTLSCGCLRNENRFTHGLTQHPLYGIWDAMKQRCFNANNRHYKDYGGRGITVCQRWLSNFSQFLEDMGPRPDGYSLDRIDNDKGYSPGNCKWSTPLEQAHNRRPQRRNDDNQTN